MWLDAPALGILVALASCSTPATVDSALSSPPSGPPGERRPVVVELFSSEGCSSCPPADDVLRALDEAQPVPGAEVIALELHVDYWNDLGWEDPFSDAAFTARQTAYGAAFQQRGAYTPQMVVDGRAEFIGSRADAARRAVAAARGAQKARVRVERRGDVLDVSVGDIPDGGEPLTVWLAITESGLRTAVKRGENAGAMLAHAPVVRRLSKLGAIAAGTKGPAFAATAALAFEPAWQRDNLRAVVLVQRDLSLHVVGAGAIALR